MNTKKAAEAMTLIAAQYADKRKMPNWKELSSIIVKRLEKAPGMSIEELAESALRASKDNGSTNVE